MKTKLKRLIAVARQVSSPNTDDPVPDAFSRPRPARALSQALDVQDWAEGQGFSILISRITPERVGALRLSFSGRFQYG